MGCYIFLLITIGFALSMFQASNVAWIIFFLIGIGIPVAYKIISFILDNREVKRRNALISEEKITSVTTYQNSNVSEEDIMNLFLSQYLLYHQHPYMHHVCECKVYSDKDKQNYSWSLTTTKYTYGWGIIYEISFGFSNGYFILKLCNTEFHSGGIHSSLLIRDQDLVPKAQACCIEARTMWKINGREPGRYLPFLHYLILPEDWHSSTKKNSPSHEPPPQADMIVFYRSLLDLKLHFTYGELKAAYREAVAKYHPDRYTNGSSRDRENAEKLMKQVNEAYEFLKKTAE